VPDMQPPVIKVNVPAVEPCQFTDAQTAEAVDQDKRAIVRTALRRPASISRYTVKRFTFIRSA